jgi:hypothetical protein
MPPERRRIDAVADEHAMAMFEHSRRTSPAPGARGRAHLVEAVSQLVCRMFSAPGR